MMWKKTTGLHLAGHPMPEWKLMRKDEDEKRFTVVPTEFPADVPISEPVKEPVKTPEPVKEPQKVGQRSGGDPIDISANEKTEDGRYIGYRRMSLATKDGQWMLHSPSQSNFGPWLRGTTTAACKDPSGHAMVDCDHCDPFKPGIEPGEKTKKCTQCAGSGSVRQPPPGDNCHCGLYATWKEPDLKQEYGSEEEWTAQVAAWGDVVTGENRPRVMRAQHMQIIGIKPPRCEQCPKSSTTLISANADCLSGRPTCDEHRPEGISGGTQAVHVRHTGDVAKELSDYYGGAKVRYYGQAWDENDMSEFEGDFGKEGGLQGPWKQVDGTWSRVGVVYPKAQK